MIERTPLDELDGLPIDWISREAPELITDVLRALGDPFGSTDRRLAAQARDRTARLGRLWPSNPVKTLPRDLAALQALLIAALRREVPEAEIGAFARAVERLAEVFGAMQATVTESLVEERSGGAARDELTDLACAPHLHELLRMLTARDGAEGRPLALLAIQVDGLDRLRRVYGDRVSDRMLIAVANMTRQRIDLEDEAFRIADDEFCVVSPGRDAAQALPLAERLRAAIDGWQSREGPRASISIGIAGHPEHAQSGDELQRVAEEAAYRARATGEGVAVGGAPGPTSLQPL